MIDRGTTKEPSLTIARYLIPLFQKHFPNRLAQLSVFPVAGASSWMLWSAIKVLLDKTTLQKVIIWREREKFSCVDTICEDPLIFCYLCLTATFINSFKVSVSEKSCLNDYLKTSSDETTGSEVGSSAIKQTPKVQTQSNLLLERLDEADSVTSATMNTPIANVVSATNLDSNGSPLTLQSDFTPVKSSGVGGFLWSKFRQTSNSKETPTSASKMIDGGLDSNVVAVLAELVEVLWEAPDGALPEMVSV